MLLKEIVKKLGEKDSYEILLWLSFLAEKISCVDCIETCKLKQKIPQCQMCVPAKNLIKKYNLGKKENQNGSQD